MEARYAGIDLTGSIVYEELADCAIMDAPSVLESPGVRTDEPFIRSLGNRGTSISLAVWRFYPTMLEAMAARGSFIKSLPTSGKLYLTQTSLGGTLLHVADAWLMPTPSPIYKTRAAFFIFEFKCKKLTTTLTTADFLLDHNGEIVLDHLNQPVWN